MYQQTRRNKLDGDAVTTTSAEATPADAPTLTPGDTDRAGGSYLDGPVQKKDTDKKSKTDDDKDAAVNYKTLPTADELDGWLPGALDHSADVIKMPASKLKALVEMIGHAKAKGDATAGALIDAIVVGTSDAKVIQACFTVRYQITKWKKKWAVEALRRIWEVFKDLPEEHTSGNAAAMSTWKMVSKKFTGYYDGEDKEVGIGYKKSKIDKGTLATESKRDNESALKEVNIFDHVIRHEVGHAVDATIGASDTYCKMDAGGGWTDYDVTVSTTVEDIEKGVGGGFKDLDAKGKSAAKQALRDAMKASNANHVMKGLKQAEKKGELAKGAATALCATDPVVLAVLGGLKGGAYADSKLPPLVGGHYYHESYPGRWVRYSANARGKKVSNYQFRAPGEWFAEAYAAYYAEAEGAGEDKKWGKLLRGLDPTTAKFIDEKVHGKLGLIKRSDVQGYKDAEKTDKKKGGDGSGSGGGKGD